MNRTTSRHAPDPSAVATRRMSRRQQRARWVAVCAAALAGAVTTLAAAAPTAEAADGRCLLPDVAGDTTVDVRFGGTSYPVRVYVPDGARRKLPLLLNLHGSSTNGSIQMQVSGMRAVADDEGFIVAAPNGAIPVPPPPSGEDPDGSWAWNVPGVPLAPGQFPPPTAR